MTKNWSINKWLDYKRIIFVYFFPHHFKKLVKCPFPPKKKNDEDHSSSLNLCPPIFQPTIFASLLWARLTCDKMLISIHITTFDVDLSTWTNFQLLGYFTIIFFMYGAMLTVTLKLLSVVHMWLILIFCNDCLKIQFFSTEDQISKSLINKKSPNLPTAIYPCSNDLYAILLADMSWFINANDVSVLYF